MNSLKRMLVLLPALGLLELSAQALVSPQTFYCTGKTTSHGCVPFLSTTGTPSVGSGLAFFINSNDHIQFESGKYLYSLGKADLNFHGGKLCVKSPFKQLTSLIKGIDGIPCVSCAPGFNCRMFKRNFNQHIQSGIDPTLTAGASVKVQFVQRDPPNPSGWSDNLSNAVVFTIGP